MSQSGKAEKRSPCHAWSTWMFPVGVWVAFKSADGALMYSEGRYYLLIKMQFLSCQFAVFTACWPAGSRVVRLMKMWTGNNLVLQSEAFLRNLQTKQKNWGELEDSFTHNPVWALLQKTSLILGEWALAPSPQKTLCEYGEKKNEREPIVRFENFHPC